MRSSQVYIQLLLIAALIQISLNGCTNSRLTAYLSDAVNSNTNTNTTFTGDTYKISTVTILSTGSSSGASGSQNKYTTSIFFNTSTSTAAISDHCQGSSTTGASLGKPCSCLFTWQEVNTLSGNSISIPRSVKTSVTLVQPSFISCEAPSVYESEILDGTTLRVSVVAGEKSEESFLVTPYSLVKNINNSDSSTAGSFRDAQGRAFINILRYSCYDINPRGMSILNKIGQYSHPNTGEVAYFPLASQFCVTKVNGNSTASEGCVQQSTDYSAQSYYYNLYIRENAVGDINPGNKKYTCPSVIESLYSNNSVGTQGKYWPLDSSFALSMGKTTDFPIGIVSNTKTSNDADPSSAATTCDSTQSTPAASNSLVQSCLGFAARPNTDGTCPTLKDPSGVLRPTYRLRRYFSLYPRIFDTDGKWIETPQSIDTIYVLDRPVLASSNPDPSKPYTMHGPKPCPFAYFDHKKVLGVTDSSTPAVTIPTYASTGDSRWTGKSIDGIELPNFDFLGNANTPPSCAAVLPILSSDRTVISLGTVHSLNPEPKMQHVYIRPTTAWSPHYQEDTSFEACAPASNNPKDPPLHFAKNTTTGNVSWCAEVYPNQNNNLSKLQTLAPGELPNSDIRPFTSHVVKNSSSTECSAHTAQLTFPNGYSTGKAYHLASDPIDTRDGTPATAVGADKTCDRTVVNPVNGITWPRFPLLAPPLSTEEALLKAHNENYACMISFDRKSGKTGTSTPTGGCCGANVKVWTGNSVNSPNTAKSGHLEPDAPCLMPQY